MFVFCLILYAFGNGAENTWFKDKEIVWMIIFGSSSEYLFKKGSD